MVDSTLLVGPGGWIGCQYCSAPEGYFIRLTPGSFCGAINERWMCTRVPGHEDPLHVACNPVEHRAFTWVD